MRSLLGTMAIVLLCATPVSAEVAWTGDFETGDFDQYNFLLNPTINNVDYTTLVQDVVLQGDWAARIELHDDARWSNDLRRVELQHAPEDARTAEGALTFFAWSFYFPEEIATDPATQICYWESGNSYQQMMAFTLRGRDLSFTTRRPNNVTHWTGEGVVTPGEWHRVAMSVLWSKNETGLVSVWFDGVEVVTDAPAQTLADDNPHFVQFGMLRGNMDFADVPVVYLDDAIEADSLGEVRPNLPAPPMDPAPTDMGGSEDMGVPPNDMSGPTPDLGGPTPDMGTPGADTGSQPGSDMAGSAPPSEDVEADGCGCAQAPTSDVSLWLIAIVGFLGVGRRAVRSRF